MKLKSLFQLYDAAAYGLQNYSCTGWSEGNSRERRSSQEIWGRETESKADVQLQAWGLFVLEFMDEKKAKREKQSKPQEEHACLLYEWVSKKIKSCVPEIEKILIF